MAELCAWIQTDQVWWIKLYWKLLIVHLDPDQGLFPTFNTHSFSMAALITLSDNNDEHEQVTALTALVNPSLYIALILYLQKQSHTHTHTQTLTNH